MLQKLLDCERRLQEDDCFSNPRKRSQNYSMLFLRLGFSLDEAYEFYLQMENASEVRGILFRKWDDGTETPVETVLNPEIEMYYQRENGTIFKVRNGIDFLSLAQRWRMDPGWFPAAEICRGRLLVGTL